MGAIKGEVALSGSMLAKFEKRLEVAGGSIIINGGERGARHGASIVAGALLQNRHEGGYVLLPAGPL